LTCIRVSRAYLKRLLGSVSYRISVENSSVLREDCLGLNCYMYFSISLRVLLVFCSTIEVYLDKSFC